jgi:hypothetical protein
MHIAENANFDSDQLAAIKREYEAEGRERSLAAYGYVAKS